MNTVEILKAAKELISDENKWTQGNYGRVHGEGVGFSCDERLPGGTDCFCAIGSLAWVGNLTIREAESSKAFEILGALAGSEVHDFNDNNTHADVLDLFERAIARAESGAA